MGWMMTTAQLQHLQYVQLQNNISVTQLNAMGYSDNHLQVQFWLDKIWEWQAALAPVMIAQTRRKHKEAIAMAITAGGHFYVTGGGTYVMMDNDIIIDHWQRAERQGKEIGQVGEGEEE